MKWLWAFYQEVLYINYPVNYFSHRTSPFPLFLWSTWGAIKSLGSCSSFPLEETMPEEHHVLLQQLAKEPLIDYWGLLYFHPLLSRQFVTAKCVFNGKTSQRMSPPGPVLFLKVFMNVYITLWFIFRLAEAGDAGLGTRLICFLGQKPIYQRGAGGGWLPARPGAGRLLSQGCQLVHLSDFHPKFQQNNEKTLFLVVLYI